jgi:hypothetical protein
MSSFRAPICHKLQCDPAAPYTPLSPLKLPKRQLLDTLLNMSKKVSAREFLHGFADIQKDLRPGESVTITRHGQTVGEFTKKQAAPKIKMPDFKKDASRPGLDVKAGDRLLARLLRDEAFS